MNKVLYWGRMVVGLLLGLLLCLHAPLSAANTDTRARGHVDSITYDGAHQQLYLNGWAWDNASAQTAQHLRITVNGTVYDSHTLRATPREDARAALGISVPDIGFVATLLLPEALPPGSYAVQIAAVFKNGGSLSLTPAAPMVLDVPAQSSPMRHWALLALVACVVALAYVPGVGRRCQGFGASIQQHPARVVAGVVACFALLVTLGVTGSSWLLLIQGREAPLVEFEGSKAHAFALRDIRADEWGILTTNALAQWNHVPRFPIVNQHIGLEGQNMGVIGMTGVPIAQPAALVRPATWGYFLLPLRQAMSWHWLFPFFACFLVLWRALGLLLPARPGLNVLLAFGFCVAPYAAAWSLWPLYATFFPLSIFVVLAALLQSKSMAKGGWLGVVLGLLLAGWVLVLYPPWQITVGTFMLFFILGWLGDHWEQLQWRKPQWLAAGLATVVAAGFFGSWWADTAGAVAHMQATVYPGQRSALQGADISGAPWWTLRGYLNVEALPFGLGAGAQQAPGTVGVNQSELSSYLVFPLPVALLSLWLAWRSTSRLRWTLRACIGFAVFWSIFRFAGVPLWLAKWSLWSHVPGIRLDLAMGLACTALLAVFAAQRQRFGAIGQAATSKKSCATSWPHFLSQRWLAAAVAVGSAGVVAWEFHLLPPGFLQANSAALQGALVLAALFGAWWLMRGHIGRAAGMLVLLSLVATLGFNPVSQSPRKIQLSAATLRFAVQNGQPLRTLALSGDAKAAVTLAAAGVPMVNGVLYYPQRSLWEQMRLPQEDWQEVNRYQHLSFSAVKIADSNRTYTVSGEHDAVRVTVDPQRFDFATTGAERVVAGTDKAALLSTNPTLTKLGSADGFVWFAVTPLPNPTNAP